MQFLVEVTHHRLPTTDLGYHLIEAVKYQNWYNNYKTDGHSVMITTKGDDYATLITGSNFNCGENSIPVGTIEFVEYFMQNYTKKQFIKPINIPDELNKMDFVQRRIWYGTKDDIVQLLNNYSHLFIKSNTRCKKFTDIINKSDLPRIAEDNYMISTIIETRSEWRVFVYKNRILDIRQYNGNWYDQPNISFIERAVAAYKHCPPAYCLDVAILKDGESAVIEVHNFISCGLHGFEDYRYLPQMVVSAYKYEINKSTTHHLAP